MKSGVWHNCFRKMYVTCAGLFGWFCSGPGILLKERWYDVKTPVLPL